MDCSWTPTKLRWYILSVMLLIHGLPQGIKGESCQRCSTENVNSVSSGSWSSSRTSQTQEDETKDYSGWRVLRLFPPAQMNVSWVLQVLEAMQGVVVLKVAREKSRMAVDVAASPDTSLTELLDDAEGDGSPSRRRRTVIEGLMEWKMVLEYTLDGFIVKPTPQLKGLERLAWDDYYRYSSIASFARGLADRRTTVECLTLGHTAQGRPLLALLFATNARRMAKFYSRRLMKVRRERNGEGGWQQTLASLTKSTKNGDGAPAIKALKEDHNTKSAETVSDDHDAERAKSKNLHRRTKSAKSKQIILVEAGAHAREWIGPAVATYLAQQLADAGKVFLKHVNFIIVPVLNPDGYEFSHTNDRLWRKNRNSNGLLSCPGVDLNRNWETGWGEEEGSSDNPCSFIYRGSKAFSEVETRALAELAGVFRKKLKFFVSLHSFGEYVLYPWGHTMDEPSRRGKLKKMAKTITERLNLNKYNTTRYKYGQTSHLLYRASGAVDDFIYSLGVPFSYTIELPRDSFVLPPEEILPVAQGLWETLVCVAGEVVQIDRAKSFCNKRLVKVEGFGSNKTLKAWINKRVPLQEAMDIVRMRYLKRMKVPEVALSDQTR